MTALSPADQSAVYEQSTRMLYAAMKTAYYDVMRDFGAKGDGSADDTSAIQAAITQVQAEGGGTLYFPPGTYNITATLAITANNVRLQGAGPASILFANVTGASTINILSVTSVSNIAICDLALNGNKANRTTSGTETQQNGIHLNGCNQCIVRSVYAHDNPASGITLTLSTYCIIESNECYSNGRNGIYLNFSNNYYNLIKGNVCQNSRDYHGIACSNSQWNTFAGNVCNGNAGSGIDLDGTSSYNAIGGNVLYNNAQSGLFLDTVVGFSATYCSVVGNVIEGNKQEGIRLIDAQYNTIIGNAITNNSQQTPNAYDGIRIETGSTGASNNLIANNKISVNHKNGIELISSTSTGNIIENNDLRGNTSNGLVLVSGYNAIVRFNQGFVTEAHGSASITSGNTTVVVTHGLGITPTLEQISITAQTAFGSAAKYWVSSPTSTQFTINVDANPGQTVTFGWKADVGY